MISYIKTRARAVLRAMLGDFDKSTEYLSRTSRPLDIARKTSTKDVANFDQKLADICEHFGVKQREYKNLPKNMQKILLNCRIGELNRKRAMRRANSLMTLYRIWQWNECRCYLCEKKKMFKQITADHVFPKSRGFQLSGNSMPACGECNNVKQDRLPTPDEVQKSCAAYAAIDRSFNPVTNDEENSDEPWKLFEEGR